MEDRQHITTPLRPTRPKIQYLGKAHGGRGRSTPRVLVPATNPLTHPMRPLTQSIAHHHDDASQINMTFCEETGEIVPVDLLQEWRQSQAQILDDDVNIIHGAIEEPIQIVLITSYRWDAEEESEEGNEENDDEEVEV